MTSWLALFILALAAMLLVGSSDGAVAGIDSWTFGSVAVGLALLVYLSGGLFSQYGGRAGPMFRDAVTWLALGLGLVTLYAYRDDLMPIAGRVAGELLPGTAMNVEQGATGVEIKIRRRLDGHFAAKVGVNGEPITMVVDTGASSIVLRPEDAKAAGIDIDSLSYSAPVMTANGRTFAARVQLESVTIGPVEKRNVTALVAKKGALHQSLLGMSFLSRLRSYEFTGDLLTLRT
ncbi:MAG TPA: TIGR02281 family clan AA aspartic protease [Methyloceanibacter sp.]|nr:TIGR02281 family clan AA aspartic protease [Methyloceanibacter sp.]